MINYKKIIKATFRKRIEKMLHMKSKFLFCCFLLAAFCLHTVAEQGSYDASSYIKDGLLGHWDAISNRSVNEPHDPQALVWTNLAADTMHATAGRGENTPVWTNGNAIASLNPVATTGKGRFEFATSEEMLAALNTGTFTIQTTLKVADSSDNMSPVWLAGGIGTRPDYTGSHYFKWGSTQFAIGNYLSDWKAGTTDSIVWNGSQIIRSVGVGNCDKKVGVSSAPAGNLKGNSKIGHGYSDNYGGDMFIHSLRFYDRALYDIENAYNAHIDSVRYFGAAKRTTKWVDSYSQTTKLYGTPLPGYGKLIEVEEGSSYKFSILSSLTEFEADGVVANKISNDSRAVFLGSTITEISDGHINKIDYPADVYEIECEIKHDTFAVWKFKQQYLFTAIAGDGGKIKVADGEPIDSFSKWNDTDQSVTVTAIPEEGGVFICWAGDVAGNPLEMTQLVPFDKARKMTALFLPSGTGDGSTYEWSGSAGDNVYFNPANWKNGKAPLANDHVLIAPAAQLTLEIPASTPRYASFTVGTGSGSVQLKMRNWDTALNADIVRIGPKATVSPYSSFTDSEMSNRVWIVCRDLTLDAQGVISATRLGYASSHIRYSGGANTDGYGPGNGRGNRGGAGHGGRGGHGYDGNFNSYALTYDNPLDPQMPGSSGGKSGGTVDTSGGGVIRVDATGRVSLWGKVVANGDGVSSASGSGAGGTINIRSETFDGTNVICASGHAYGGTDNITSGRGGGGMIAIRYDTAKQAAAGLSPTPILKAAWRTWGLRFFPGKTGATTTSSTANRVSAQDGTIYLSDSSFFKGEVLLNAVGRVAFGENSLEYSFDSFVVGAETGVGTSQYGRSISITNERVVVSGDFSLGRGAVVIFKDCDVTIGGNVSVDGGWIDCIGNTTFSVAGSLTLSSDGVMRIWSGPTNGVDAAEWRDYGALLKVAGNVRLEGNSVLYTQSEGRNGGSPRFEMKSLYVAKDAQINGVGRGWGFYDYLAFRSGSGFGYGLGASYRAGAAYGGLGASNFAHTSKEYHKGVYGDEKEPLYPGSEGGRNNQYCGGWGGGLFLAVISRDLTLEGKINMDGISPYTENTGSGSGGGVNIRCRTINGSGAISANGGVGQTSWDWSGSGGGGRIAIRCAVNNFTGSVTASKGKDKYNHTYSSSDGTIYWGRMPKSGTTIILR